MERERERERESEREGEREGRHGIRGPLSYGVGSTSLSHPCTACSFASARWLGSRSRHSLKKWRS